MLNAGTATAAFILRDYADRLADGVVVYAGAGNNGGDACVVAAQLARAGVRVHLITALPAQTEDARRAAALAARWRSSSLVITELAKMQVGGPGEARNATPERTRGQPRLVIDGLLGTGHHGALREPLAACCAQIRQHRADGAAVVALDIPSGLDASTGETAAGAVSADATVTYGTIKRGLLRARHHVGRVVLVDIGLGPHAHGDDGAWQMADAASLARRMPPIAWDAHKGSRGHLTLVGGSDGMVGAIILACRAALASGLGLARAHVHGGGVSALQQAVPQAICTAWDTSIEGGRVARADALVIGPGLGRTTRSAAVMRGVLESHPDAPVVLDADALTLLAQEGGDVAARLRRWCGTTRAVVCTPHIGEFARLVQCEIGDGWDERARLLCDFAERARATVVLKGTPTLLASADRRADDGRVIVSMIPRGTAVLATGGSGDLLTGIVGALLAQHIQPYDAALLGCTAHGMAAELVAQSGVRGHTLDDVLGALPQAWRGLSHPPSLPRGILTVLPGPEEVQ